jgi:hypothetical protein
MIMVRAKTFKKTAPAKRPTNPSPAKERSMRGGSAKMAGPANKTAQPPAVEMVFDKGKSLNLLILKKRKGQGRA